MRPYLEKVPFPHSLVDAENSEIQNMAATKNVVDAPTLELPIIQEENETDIQEEQPQTRSCHKEARLTVMNVNDENIPSFQLLTPQLTQEPRRRIPRPRVRGVDGPELQIPKEEMGNRKMINGCNDVVRQKEDLSRLGERIRPGPRQDVLLMHPSRFSNCSSEIKEYFQSTKSIAKCILIAQKLVECWTMRV
jgi:hypothetical protein